MKRVKDLDIWQCVTKEQEQAVDYLKFLGFKPHPFDKYNVRVHIKGCYFDYNSYRGKWSYCRSSGQRKWNYSSGLDDFVLFGNRIDGLTSFRYLFMHEFGHNLNGNEIDTYHQSKAYDTHCSNSNCVMFEKDSGGGRNEDN